MKIKFLGPITWQNRARMELQVEIEEKEGRVREMP